MEMFLSLLIFLGNKYSITGTSSTSGLFTTGIWWIWDWLLTNRIQTCAYVTSARTGVDHYWCLSWPLTKAMENIEF